MYIRIAAFLLFSFFRHGRYGVHAAGHTTDDGHDRPNLGGSAAKHVRDPCRSRLVCLHLLTMAWWRFTGDECLPVSLDCSRLAFFQDSRGRVDALAGFEPPVTVSHSPSSLNCIYRYKIREYPYSVIHSCSRKSFTTALMPMCYVSRQLSSGARVSSQVLSSALA